MKSYLDLAAYILDNGQDRGDRTGTGARGIFGPQLRFDLSAGFPLLTTKRVYFKGVVEELLWFLRGATNTTELQDAGVHIWDEWTDEEGNLGPIYGHQWRNWAGVDQIAAVIRSLQARPDSRRHIVNAWNVEDLPDETLSPQQNVAAGRMALPPCHVLFQFYVDQDSAGFQRLSCQVYQRSADVFLGVPFNIASYALLTELMAHHLNMVPGELVWVGGDTHIYHNHFKQIREQLTRKPGRLPGIALLHQASTALDLVEADDIELFDYHPAPAIKAPVAV